jgi:hypothetical protein
MVLKTELLNYPDYSRLFVPEKVKASRYTPWRRLGGEEVCSYSFTSALGGGEWSASRPVRALPRGKGPLYPWVGPTAGLDAEDRRKILCLCRGSNPGRSVRSQTLYWLSYPCSSYLKRVNWKPNFKTEHCTVLCCTYINSSSDVTAMTKW